MKRYLIIYFDSEGSFCTRVEMADNLATALGQFFKLPIAWEEVYSITRAA